MFGLLGSEDESNRTVPVRLGSFSTPVTSVAVGSTHALAVGMSGGARHRQSACLANGATVVERAEREVAVCLRIGAGFPLC